MRTDRNPKELEQSANAFPDGAEPDLSDPVTRGQPDLTDRGRPKNQTGSGSRGPTQSRSVRPTRLI